jgi:parallel beta-helix repeat protein
MRSNRFGARAGAARVTAVLVAMAVGIGLVACQPLPPPDPTSTLVDCSQAGAVVTLTSSSHLDPSCTYAGIEIATSGVTLDCQGAKIVGPTNSGSRGILVRAPQGVALSNITVRNCHVEGYLNSVRVTRDGFRNLAQGEEYLTPTSNIVIEDSTFKGSRGTGIFVDGYVEDVTIRDNTIDGAGSVGIYLETGSRRNRVEGNSIINNGYRENGANGQLATFGTTQVWWWGVGREGLAVDGSYENVIVDNAFYNNSNGGLFLYKNCGEYPSRPSYFERRYHARDNLIEGNTFIGGRNGVWVGSRMGENTYPMECTDPAYINSGITRVVLDYAEDNVVRDNRFVEVTYGVRVEDDRTTVEGNRFEASTTGKHGVVIGTPHRTSVLGLPVTDTILRNNVSTLAGNANPYRWIHGQVGTVVEGNTAGGVPTGICQGQAIPRQQLIFVIAAVPAGPGGTPPATTPDLTVPVLGELPPCSAPS